MKIITKDNIKYIELEAEVVKPARLEVASEKLSYLKKRLKFLTKLTTDIEAKIKELEDEGIREKPVKEVKEVLQEEKSML